MRKMKYKDDKIQWVYKARLCRLAVIKYDQILCRFFLTSKVCHMRNGIMKNTTMQYISIHIRTGKVMQKFVVVIMTGISLHVPDFCEFAVVFPLYFSFISS